jgi:predicted membrane protein
MTVGLVVYPSFGIVDEASWPAFHSQHVARITWAVAAPWAAQALGLVLWLVRLHHGISTTWVLCAGSAAAAVVVTAGWAIRVHNQLHTDFDPRRGRVLRRAHWVRTACWLAAAIAATAALSSL